MRTTPALIEKTARSILRHLALHWFIALYLTAILISSASAGLHMSYETSDGTHAYGTWDTNTLTYFGVYSALPAQGDIRGLAVDGTGNVYVGQVSGLGQSTVYKFDSTGSLLLTSPVISASIQDFAIPEPSTLAIALTALMVATRRRR